MSERYFHLVLGATLCIVAGCAQQPQKPDPGAPQAVSTATDKAVPPDLMALARDNGYRARTVNGKLYFCKSETPIGSLLSKTFCIDKTQLQIEMQRERNERQRLMQPNQCGPTANCGGG